MTLQERQSKSVCAASKFLSSFPSLRSRMTPSVGFPWAEFDLFMLVLYLVHSPTTRLFIWFTLLVSGFLLLLLLVSLDASSSYSASISPFPSSSRFSPLPVRRRRIRRQRLQQGQGPADLSLSKACSIRCVLVWATVPSFAQLSFSLSSSSYLSLSLSLFLSLSLSLSLSLGSARKNRFARDSQIARYGIYLC